MFWRGTKKTSHKARVHSALLITLGLIAGLTVATGAAVVEQSVAEAARPAGTGQNNPDLAAACGTDVIVILDESGSVGPFESQL